MGSSRAEDILPCLVLLFLLFFSSQSTEFGVGGRHGSWKIPSSPDAYTKWSEKLRFQIGDILVLEYDPNNDSVLEVGESDYNNCNREHPLRAFHDGKTKIQLDRSGPFYFISGAQGHCDKGQKFIVRVLSAKHGSGIQRAPAPISVPFAAPAPAPFVSAPTPAQTNNGGHMLKFDTVVMLIGSVVAFTFLELAVTLD